jgi:SAM-dependent methyltransferase
MQPNSPEWASDPPNTEYNLAFQTPDSELFFPEADETLGIEKTLCTEENHKAQFRKYGYVLDLMQAYLDQDKLVSVGDVGCGSGYGTNQLRLVYGSKVYGCDPNDRAIEYAAHNYPETIFRAEAQPKSDVLVFVDSIASMTPAEFRYYLASTDLAVVTLPVIKNDYVLGPGGRKMKSTGEFFKWMMRRKFFPVAQLIDDDLNDWRYGKCIYSIHIFGLGEEQAPEEPSTDDFKPYNPEED